MVRLKQEREREFHVTRERHTQRVCDNVRERHRSTWKQIKRKTKIDIDSEKLNDNHCKRYQNVVNDT